MDKTYSRKTYYKSVTQLNPDDSPSTGSIVCYDGDIEYSDDGEQPCIFVEIADCHGKVRLHRSHTDTMEDFIGKIDAIIRQLSYFCKHLIYESPHKSTKRQKPHKSVKSL